MICETKKANEANTIESAQTIYFIYCSLRWWQRRLLIIIVIALVFR